MDNAEKLARGGVHISPSGPDGKKLSLIIRFALKHIAALPVAYERLHNYDKGLTTEDPSFESMLHRVTMTGALAALDYAAIILALTDMDVETCVNLFLTAADRERIHAALYQYLPHKSDYTEEELDKINSADTAAEVQQNFLEICRTSRHTITSKILSSYRATS